MQVVLASRRATNPGTGPVEEVVNAGGIATDCARPGCRTTPNGALASGGSGGLGRRGNTATGGCSMIDMHADSPQ